MDLYDLVIKNGTVINPRTKYKDIANIGIKNNKISIISKENLNGKTSIDAGGKIVCPGFIDIHGHIDGNIECAELSLVQGVTTTVGGNCGLSPINIKEFFHEQDKKGFPINQAELIGQSFSLREVVGADNPYIKATSIQIERMCKLAEKAFKDGAIGLSFGLEYAPGSSFDEVIELSRIAAKYNKIVPIHTNVQNPTSLCSLNEVVRIAEITGAHILISHFVYQYGMGLMTEALEIVEDARNRGLKISVDSGMYTAFCTNIGTAIYDESYMQKFGWKFSDLLAASGIYKGKRLNKAMYDELRANHKKESVICFTGVEDEIYEALMKDYVMLSSDTGPSPTGLSNEGHPQNAGTFPRFFRKMVREKKYISIMKAIEKCTLLPSRVFGLTDKGKIEEGADADIVIFDIDKIMDKSDFPGIGMPDAKPEGIDYVIVNGQIAVNNGDIVKGVLAGRTIRDIC